MLSGIGTGYAFAIVMAVFSVDFYMGAVYKKEKVDN